MIKPTKLREGDKIATITLSFGGGGAFPHRYEAGKRQLMETLGLEVIETKHALKPPEWIEQSPQARADDLMEAFQDESIKAIISIIGGDDSIRTLPHIDLDVIKNNPKIFMGFSDTTITHFCCYKAGLVSFYGTAILVGFAENGGMHSYQIADLKQTLFEGKAIGEVLPNPEGWTSERLEWGVIENQSIHRKLQTNTGWRFLQGRGKVEGTLLGGCMEVLEFLKDTPYWVKPEDWKGKIMFLETSEEMPTPLQFQRWLRNYAASGILQNINGLILGRPYENQYWEEYDEILLKVVKEEAGLGALPIISGMDFGHTCPIFTLPYGVNAKIDCAHQKFSILESGVK